MAMKRRVFLAGLGSAGLGFGLGGFSHLFPLRSRFVGPDWSPGDETAVPSTCLLCPSHCGILGRVVDGRLVRIDGNPLHPVSRGGLCPKGRAGLQMLYHPARLTTPLQRQSAVGPAPFEATSWDAALERVALALSSLSDRGQPDRLAWLIGNVQGSMAELIERFVRVYGSPHLLRESYADGSDEVMELSQGIRAQPALDLDQADLILSFGAALSEAWWCLPQAARARDLPPGRRCRWVQLDTRLSRTAIAADQWIPLRPDSYGLMALSIAYVLLKEGLYDADWIRDGVTGFEDWSDTDGNRVPGYRSLVLRHGSPETIAPRIGVDAPAIVRLAKEFGRSPRPLAVWDQAVTWRSGGLSDALAIHALNILSGALERPGGVYVQPPLPMRSLNQRAPATAGGETLPAASTDGAQWADRVLAGDLSIDVLFLYYSNPVASAADPDKIRRALGRIPLVVSFSPFLDESASCAHLVLPDHTYLERWQDAPSPPSVPYPVWGLVQPIVQPLHDTRPTGEVVLDLASRTGGRVAAAFPWSSMKHLVEERGKELAAVRRGGTFASGFRREELREMESRGWWLSHGLSPDEFWKDLRATGGWFDPFHDDRSLAAASRRPDRRVALFSDEARSRVARAQPGFAEGFLFRGDSRDGYEPEAPDGSPVTLRLMPYRVLTLSSGTTTLMPWLLENLGPTGSAWEPWVEIHPETARQLGLGSAQTVRLVSDHGAFTARLCRFPGVQPGVVNAPYGLHTSVHGWGTIEGANPLAAVGEIRDPVTGLPDWYATRVRVEAV